MKELFTWIFLISVDWGGVWFEGHTSSIPKQNSNVNNLSLMNIPKILSFLQNLRLV